MAEVNLAHFRVRHFCAVVSSSLQNAEVLGLNLRTGSMLSNSTDHKAVEKKIMQKLVWNILRVQISPDHLVGKNAGLFGMNSYCVQATALWWME